MDYEQSNSIMRDNVDLHQRQEDNFRNDNQNYDEDKCDEDKLESNIYLKLNTAREIVRKGKYKKDGRNDYSEYDYFTPETVEKIVWEVCQKTNLMPICNLYKDELGYFQQLDLIDLDDLSKLVFVLRTEKGNMKATNDTQQMGGTDTYSERYLKMKVFQIKDNNLDFDSKDHREAPKKKETASDLDL